MNIKISKIADAGSLEKERVVFEVSRDGDLGDFTLLQSGMSNGVPTIKIYNTYWFPDEEVKAGDLVVLYTKRGTKNQRDNAGGFKSHFFYWGLDEEIWSYPDRAAVTLHSPTWELFRLTPTEATMEPAPPPSENAQESVVSE